MMQGNQAELFAERQKGALPGDLGIEWQEVANGAARGGALSPRIGPARALRSS